MKRIFFGLFGTAAILVAANCAGNEKAIESNSAEGTEDTTMVVAGPDTVAHFYGTYMGMLPAADCEGIKTTLTLNDDTTYELVSEYIGKGDGPVVTNGVYNRKGADVVELVRPSSGEKTYYKLLEKAVALSDSVGTLNEGELADFYILKKQ